MFFKQFLRVFFRDFADAFVFVNTDHWRLFAHALALHLLDFDLFFETGFLDEFLETILNFAVVSATFLAVAQVDYFLGFFGFAHDIVFLRHKCISIILICSK